MMRKVALYVVATSLLHVVIAAAEIGAMRAAEGSGLRVFSGLARSLVFADVPKYLDHANQAAAGKIPYREDPLEYPILALPFLYVPRLFTRSQLLFVGLFAAEMLVFDAALVALVAGRVARTCGPNQVPGRLGWLTLCFAAVAPFVMGRYDAVPALFGFASACLWFGGRPATGGMLAALGALIKIAPGAVAVPGLLSEAVTRGRRGWRGTLAFMLALGAGFAAWWGIGRAGMVDSIRYHSERGVEIGSVPSGVLWAWGWALGSPMSVRFDHQSTNLVAPGVEVAARMALPIQAVAMLVVVAGFLRGRGRDPFRFAGAATLAFAVGGKVISPQYLIWVMPFVAAQEGAAGRRARPLFLLAALLTMVLYPWAFRSLEALAPWTFAILNARNVALLATLVVLIRCRIGPPLDAQPNTDPPLRPEI